MDEKEIERCEHPKVVLQEEGQSEVIYCTRPKGHDGEHRYNFME